MQVMAHAMSHILADNGKTVLLHQCLNRCADIADPMAGLRRLNTQIQAFLRYVQKLLGLFADLPHRKGKRIVSVESADTGAHINADDVPFPQDPLRRGNPMDHFVVHRNTGRPGEAAVSQEGWLSPLTDDKMMENPIQLQRGHPRPDIFAGHHKCLCGDLAGFFHPLQLRFVF